MFHELLIRCCAPTMASLKTGNMFSCPFSSREEMTAELRKLNRRLGQKGLRILPLRWENGRALVYLYRPHMLEKDLRNDLGGQAPGGMRLYLRESQRVHRTADFPDPRRTGFPA